MSYKTLDGTVPAGDSATLPIKGKYLRCLEANVDFEISVDGQGQGKMGRSIGFGDDDGFKAVTLYAPQGSILTYTLAYSNGFINDSRTEANNTAAAIQTTADTSVSAGATTEIIAANSSRKTVVIENLDAANTVRWGDSNAGASRGLRIAPGVPVSIDTRAGVYIHNPGASAVSIAIAELV